MYNQEGNVNNQEGNVINNPEGADMNNQIYYDADGNEVSKDEYLLSLGIHPNDFAVYDKEDDGMEL